MRKQLRGLAGVCLIGMLWFSGATSALAQESVDLWHGTETLPGFGKLYFSFRQDYTVVMTDVKGSERRSLKGTWSHQSGDLVLRFADCEYRSTVNTIDVISGTARYFAGPQTGQTWTFKVQRGGG